MTGEPEPFDWKRLLVGDAPWWSLIEIGLRSVLIYLLLMGTMRLMGKRVAGQMSLSELAVIVTLGAAVGVPMQVQDRGMLPPVLILCIALAFQRGISRWAFESRRVEMATQGDALVLVKNGRLLLEAMRSAVLSRERLFSTLRNQSVTHLGEIERAYLETNGQLSLFKFATPRPGLCILPDFDDDAVACDDCAARHFVCTSCGYVCAALEEPGASCVHCGARRWGSAFARVPAER